MDPIRLLNDRLAIHTSALLGCHRRNSYEITPPKWRDIRGISLLEFLSDRYTIPTPIDTHDFYLFDEALIVFRGGPVHIANTHALLDEWALITIQRPLPPTITILNENKGTLVTIPVFVPPSVEANPQERVDALLASYRSSPPGRIPKSGILAIRTCPFCPHKRACDALDKLHHTDTDWSTDYPYP